LKRRRDRLLWACVSFLSLEGVALVVGRGNCPFGPLQRRLGDPVPCSSSSCLREPPRRRFPCSPSWLWPASPQLSFAGRDA